MYHISKDKRAVQSAELIWKGLEQCLQEKPFNKIRIADINEKSYISRATFYRLFDGIEDVLVYECDCIFAAVSEELAQTRFSSNRELFLFFIHRWLEHKALIKALAENNLTSIIYDTHMKNRELVKAVYVREDDLSPDEADYLVSILTNIIPAVMNIWYEHGQKESETEILRIASKSIAIIAEVLNHK